MQPTQYVPPAQPVQPVQPVQPIEARAPAQPVQSLPPKWSYRAAAERLPSESPTYRASQMVYLILGIVEALIIFRVALKLLAADSGAGFVRFIYGVSAPLVAPFQDIFPTPASNTNVLELSSLVAIVVYGLIAWGIVSVIFMLGRRQLPTTAG